MKAEGNTSGSPEAKTEAKADPKADPNVEAGSDRRADVKGQDAPAAGAAPAAPAQAPPSGEPPGGEPPAGVAAPSPDAPPASMRPGEPARARAETVAMTAETAIGAPPPVPQGGLDAVEDPTAMPGPRDIPAGSPTDPAAPPGRVPRGDSRSLRRGSEFALVYRVQTCVISRFGTIGQRGQWRVVEYPTSSAASNAYAKECSRFVSDGFSDYRD